MAGGDVTLGYHLPEFQEELRQRGVSASERIAYPFARISETTRSADVFLVNLEGTLTSGGEPIEKSFNFQADPSAVAVLQYAGVDVVSLANNHAYDFGEEGLQQTRDTLLAAGIAAFGAGKNLAQARRPALLLRRGVRIGFLGYLYMGDHTIEPEVMYAGTDRAGVAGTHKDLPRLLGWIQEDIENLRPQVDLLVVVLHWGRESHNTTEPYQRRIADAAVAAGADLLVGHHSHTLQGLEKKADAWVAYSLGNLMFAGNWNPQRKEAALLEATFSLEDQGSQLSVQALPLHLDNLPGEPFQPRFLAGEAAERVRQLMSCYVDAREEGLCEALIDGVPEDVEPSPLPAS
jgi:poly-gamma-glutamate capsule biosynthesis protein CapA/YwtB (metallophosphatase superfamily)